MKQCAMCRKYVDADARRGPHCQSNVDYARFVGVNGMTLGQKIFRRTFWVLMLSCMGAAVADDSSSRTFKIEPQGLIDRYNKALAAENIKDMETFLRLPSAKKMNRDEVDPGKLHLLIYPIKDKAAPSSRFSGVTVEILVDSNVNQPREFRVVWSLPTTPTLELEIGIIQELLSETIYSGKNSTTVIPRLCAGITSEKGENDLSKTTQISGVTFFCERRVRRWYAGFHV